MVTIKFLGGREVKRKKKEIHGNKKMFLFSFLLHFWPNILITWSYRWSAGMGCVLYWVTWNWQETVSTVELVVARTKVRTKERGCFNNLCPDCSLQRQEILRKKLNRISHWCFRIVLRPHKLTLLTVRADWKTTMIFVLSYPLWLSTSQIDLIAAGTEGRREGSFIFQQTLPYLLSPATNYYLYWET